MILKTIRKTNLRMKTITLLALADLTPLNCKSSPPTKALRSQTLTSRSLSHFKRSSSTTTSGGSKATFQIWMISLRNLKHEDNFEILLSKSLTSSINASW